MTTEGVLVVEKEGHLAVAYAGFFPPISIHYPIRLRKVFLVLGVRDRVRVTESLTLFPIQSFIFT